jgi:hypothetical protein
LGIKSVGGRTKKIYFTDARLRKLLPAVFSTARERHFRRAVVALRAWPDVDSEKVLERASRINPQPLMDGKWSWPRSVLSMAKAYARRAPTDNIDTGKLRRVLEEEIGTPEGREKFMDMLIEELERRPVTHLRFIGAHETAVTFQLPASG